MCWTDVGRVLINAGRLLGTIKGIAGIVHGAAANIYVNGIKLRMIKRRCCREIDSFSTRKM